MIRKATESTEDVGRDALGKARRWPDDIGAKARPDATYREDIRPDAMRNTEFGASEA